MFGYGKSFLQMTRCLEKRVAEPMPFYFLFMNVRNQPQYFVSIKKQGIFFGGGDEKGLRLVADIHILFQDN